MSKRGQYWPDNEKPEMLRVTHTRCGKRAVIDFKGGVGIRCLWCGCTPRWEDLKDETRSPMKAPRGDAHAA